MNENSYILSKREFLGHCVMNIVKQAPNNIPRKIEKIIVELKTYFRQNTKQYALDKYGKPIPETSVFIDYPMMNNEQIKELVNGIDNIKEIAELNLSNNEYNKGIGLEDDRPKYHFVDRYSKEDYDNDFIDLFALKRNIMISLFDELEQDKKESKQ